MVVRMLVVGVVLVGCGSDPTPIAPTYKRISFTGVYAADQPAALAWYRDVLGVPQKGGNWVGMEDYSSIEVFGAGIASSISKAPAEQSTITGLRVPDLDAAIAALAGRGMTFRGTIATGDGERWIYGQDLDGNQLVFRQLGAATTGPTPMGTSWAGRFVENFDAMVAWYRDVLGMELVATGGTTERFARFGLTGGGVLELFSGGVASPTAAKTPASQPFVIGIQIEQDLESAMAELELRGVVWDGDIAEWSGPDWPSERYTGIVDPEGNALGIKQEL